MINYTHERIIFERCELCELRCTSTGVYWQEFVMSRGRPRKTLHFISKKGVLKFTKYTSSHIPLLFQEIMLKSVYFVNLCVHGCIYSRILPQFVMRIAYVNFKKWASSHKFTLSQKKEVL